MSDFDDGIHEALRARVAELEGQLEAMTRERDRLANTLPFIQAEHEAERDEAIEWGAALLADVQAERDLALARWRNVCADVVPTRRERDALRVEVGQAHSERMLAETERDVAIREREALRADLDVGVHLANCKVARDRAETERDAAIDRAAKAEALLAADMVVDAVYRRALAAEAERDVAIRERDALRVEVAIAHDVRKGLMAERDALRVEVSECRAEMGRFFSEGRTLEGENNALRAVNAAKFRHHLRLRGRLLRYRDEVRKLRGYLSEEGVHVMRFSAGPPAAPHPGRIDGDRLVLSGGGESLRTEHDLRADDDDGETDP